MILTKITAVAVSLGRWTSGQISRELASRAAMTLQTYDPKKLDQFALQLLDLATIVRQMASRSRECGVTNLVLHDKKALEWCAKLEQWTHKVQADLEVKIIQSRAERRGRITVK